MCVAKLHDINSELVEDQGFLDTLKVPCQSVTVHDIPVYSLILCHAGCRV